MSPSTILVPLLIGTTWRNWPVNVVKAIVESIVYICILNNYGIWNIKNIVESSKFLTLILVDNTFVSGYIKLLHYLYYK